MVSTGTALVVSGTAADRYPPGVARPTSAPPSTVASRRRPSPTDPRVAQTEQVVFAATVELVERCGPDVTVEQIAAASGVARSTIYRRWRDVDDLFLDAFDTLTRPPPVPPPTGELRADLVAFAIAYASELNDRSFFALLLFLMDESLRSPRYRTRYRAITRARRKRVDTIVRAAQARRARPIDIDIDATQLADAVMAPLFHARVGLHRLLTDDDARVAVDTALADAGLKRRAGGTGR
jgi:AcrR family transcriptional regulator